MTTLTRSAPSRIARMIFAICMAVGASAANAADPAPDWRKARDVGALTVALERWLDRESPYPARDENPAIRLISEQRAYALSGQGQRLGFRRRGLYDAETGTIYLVRPWSMRSPSDVSVLLHELVHHRQVGARHWVCPGQQEEPAYRLQDAWLAEQNASIDINWIAVTLMAGCTPRDFHPD